MRGKERKIDPAIPNSKVCASDKGCEREATSAIVLTTN